MLHVGLALLIAIALGIPGGLYGGWGGAIFFGLAAGLIAYFAMGRKISRRVEGALAPVDRHVRGGRLDRAIAELEGQRRLAWWQIGLSRMIDGQIGVLTYAQKGEADKARPYLERAPARMWHAKAMLGAIYFKKRKEAEMREVFEKALKKNKKVGMLYASYAWCENKRGNKERAIAILTRGAEKIPSDEKLKRNLLALQNKKKMQMRAYGADWWALRLESPPRSAAQQQPPPGAKPKARGLR